MKYLIKFIDTAAIKAASLITSHASTRAKKNRVL